MLASRTNRDWQLRAMSAEHIAATGVSRGSAFTHSPVLEGARDDRKRESDYFQALTDAVASGDCLQVFAEARTESTGGFVLGALQTTAGTGGVATALVTLKGPGGTRTETASGSGPVNALCKAIDRITGLRGTLSSYSARAVSMGRDGVVGVFLRADFGVASFIGHAADTDIVQASAKAYLGAVNRNLHADAAQIEMLELEALTAGAGDSVRVDDWV